MQVRDKRRRAKAKSLVNRRGSRRAVFDLVEIDGVPHSKRRKRALRRAAARVKTPRLIRKQMAEYARLRFIEEKARRQEIERMKAEGLDAQKEDN